MRKLLKKISQIAVIGLFLFLSVNTAYSSGQYDELENYPRTAGVNGTAATVQIDGHNVLNKCGKLAGLKNSKCKLDFLGTETCSVPGIVCNIKGMDFTNPEVQRFRQGEKSDYCLLPGNYCYNEALWGEGGLESFQDEQYRQSWEALEQGDLGGFLCNQVEGGTEGFLGCDEETAGAGPSYVLPIEETTFTQFGGDFEAPSPEGYSAGLVVSSGIREYVLNITNFVLGFLGLVAVLAIIYSGFIYLTAGGDEGKTDNGKKGILYAIMGILLILGSYAIVRTVICFAPVGGDDQASFCTTEGGRAVSEGQLDLTEEIGEDATTTYENAQARLLEISEGVLAVSTDYLNIQSAVDYLPSIEYGLQGGLDEGLGVLGNLKRSINNYVRSTATINTMIEYLSRERPIVMDVITEKPSRFARVLSTVIPEPRHLQAALASPEFINTNDLNDGGMNADPFTIGDSGLSVGEAPPYEPDYDITPTDPVRGPVGGFGASFEEAPPQTFEDAYDFMEFYSEELGRAAATDYEENLRKFIRFSGELETLFNGIDDAKAEMKDVTDVLGELRTRRANRDLLTDLIVEVNQAAEVVEGLEFVRVKLGASTRSCSAPCVVLFDSIGSLDPSGRTIPDEKHRWDLDGDGRFNIASDTCNEAQSATVSCIYQTPGTYVATLQIDSAEPNKYASGIATVVINVTRPRSQVKVNINSPTGLPLTYIDNTATPPVRSSRAKFTVEEARGGLQFDASGSLGSSGAPITEFIWNFGVDEFAGSNPTATYSYTQKGSYRIVLEVIENEVGERTVISLEIGSPAANFVISNLTDQDFQTGQTVIFDGGYSKSDNGVIVLMFGLYTKTMQL